MPIFLKNTNGRKHVTEFSFPSNFEDSNLEDNISLTSRNFYEQDRLRQNNVFENVRLNTWSNIPELVVITGQNGVGKSRLLSYLNKALAHERANCTKMDSDDKYYISNIYRTGMSFDKFLDDDFRGEVINAVRDHYLKEKVTLESVSSSSKANASKVYAFSIIKKLDAAGITFDLYHSKPKTWEYIVAETMIESVNMESLDAQATNPIEILYRLFYLYDKKKDAYRYECRTLYLARESTEAMHKFYCDENHIAVNQDSYDKFLSALEYNSLSKFIDKYVDVKMGIPLWEEINNILKKYNFNYSVNFDYNKGIVIKRLDNAKEILVNALSSGEKTILQMLTLEYYYRSLKNSYPENENNESSKIDVILLDEPDRHLDPKSCGIFFKAVHEIFVKEYGIQVIITTHRVDTIALAPQESVYLMERDKQDRVSINPCHKLRAILNLTRNTRQHTNFHIKVLVEGFDDARFYEKIHNLLLEERKNAANGLNAISQRYMPEFHSVSLDGKDYGGCEGVIGNVFQYLDSYKRFPNKSSSSSFPPPTMLPFGIVDNDNGQSRVKLTNFVNNFKKDIKKRNDEANYHILILKRHSLENFLYDPFILCSALEEEEDLTKIGNERIRESLKECKKSLSTKNENDIINKFSNYFATLNSVLPSLEIKTQIIKIVKDIVDNGKQGITSKNYEKAIADIQKLKPVNEQQREQKKSIKKIIDDHDSKSKDIYQKAKIDPESFVEENWPSLFNKDEKDIKKEIAEKIAKRLEEVTDNLGDIVISQNAISSYLDKKEIKSTVSSSSSQKTRKISLRNGALKSFQYPEEFLQTRGHDIEEAFQLIEKDTDLHLIKVVKDFKNIVLNRFFDSCSLCIPYDLAEIFYELSNKFRLQVNKEIKPEKVEVQTSAATTIQHSWRNYLADKKTKALANSGQGI